jgi:chromosome segregation ATPase
MNATNVLNELSERIEMLDRTINELRNQLNVQTQEMNEIGSQYQSLKTKFDMKKMAVLQLTKRLEEKTKILNEARRAYNKIVDNTTKLIDAVANEAMNDK